MDDSRNNTNFNRGQGPVLERRAGWRAPFDFVRRVIVDPVRKSEKLRWMLPWTLAAMGVAVTIAWILQPAPQPQFGFRPGFGPGGFQQGGGNRGGGGERRAGNAQVAAQTGEKAGEKSNAQNAQQQRPRPQDFGQGFPQGTAVGTAVARVGNIDVTLDALGSVTPLSIVTVRPQIAGQLQEVGFTEGQIVKKGDFIAQIDPRSYELQLTNGRSALARDKVLLDNAKRDLVRYEDLLKENAASQQQYETQKATVAQYNAAVSADEYTIGMATLNLSYCRILAPISGRIGLRAVDPGNYVTVGDANGIGVITQLSPITVLFPVPEDNLPQLQRRMGDGVPLGVDVFDRTVTTKLGSGQVASLDNLIDSTTGTVRIKATFENTDNKLFPNQFVNVRLVLNTIHDATVLPPAAIQHGAPGTFVFLVKSDDTVAIQPIKTGASNANLTQVLSGINPGDQVVIDGVDRLRDGARVFIPNPPLDPLAPTPASATTTDGQQPAAPAPAAAAPNMQQMRERMQNATPEEREEMRKQFQQRMQGQGRGQGQTGAQPGQPTPPANP